MTGRRRSSTRRKRYGGIISEPGVDEAPDQDSVDTILFVCLLFVQMYALLLYYAYWISDCEKGAKGKELKRDRKPFEEKVGSKLNEGYFRRTYSMARTSFENLHGILECRLEEIFFSRGGNKQNGNKSRYYIDTKIRLGIALRYFAGASPYDIMLVFAISRPIYILY